MQLLARPYADALDLAVRSHRVGHINQLHAGDLGDENFAAMHLFEGADHETDPLIQGDPEARHSRIGERDLATLALLHEDWHHASTAPDNIAITNATEAGVLRAGIGIGLHEHFLRAKLGCPIKVDWVYGFVGAEGGD